VVWLAVDVEAAQQVALKVYRSGGELSAGGAFDTALRTKLADERFRRYAPALLGFGLVADASGAEVAWEAMEYFPAGSLADLIRREAGTRGRLPADRVREIVAAVTDALVFWETVVGYRQIDLSPGNIMVRGEAAPDVVLADFGGVRGTGRSQAISDLQVKCAYMAPEALGNANHEKSPYWSLGAICHEMLAGESALGVGDDTVHRIILATSDPDLSAVTDPRWRLLLEGLLTRSIESRWGKDEVREWLRGGSPAVQRSPRNARSAEPIDFDGQLIDDRRILAGEMASAPVQAAEWLRQGGARRLHHWLAGEFSDHPFDPVHLTGIDRDEVRTQIAISRFAAAMLPEQRPTYRGSPVDEAGLLQLAHDRAGHAFLRQIIACNVLSVAAEHRCGHERCAGHQRCQVLSGLTGVVTAAASRARQRLADLDRELASDPFAVAFPRPLTQLADDDLLTARAVEFALDRGAVDALAARIRPDTMPRAPWWRQDSVPARNERRFDAVAVAARVVVSLLAGPAAGYRRAGDAARRTATRQRYATAFQWFANSFRGGASGVGRRFVAPAWVARPLWLVLPLAVVEPTYLAWTLSRHARADPDVMAAAGNAMNTMSPFTRWSVDWLSPMLTERWPDQRVAYAVYPVVIVLVLVVLRRTRGRSVGWTWLGLPASVLGLTFTIALVMHLLHQNLHVLWSALATMGLGVVIAPLLALAVARLLAGRP
jgi:hypothetical protein